MRLSAALFWLLWQFNWQVLREGSFRLSASGTYVSCLVGKCVPEGMTKHIVDKHQNRHLLAKDVTTMANIVTQLIQEETTQQCSLG